MATDNECEGYARASACGLPSLSAIQSFANNSCKGAWFSTCRWD
jgi:hypothetical protein